MSQGGRKIPADKQAWCERFGITGKQARNLSDSLMAQLSYCRSDECRRLILGVSERDNSYEATA
jgi:hypothetical protein